MARRSAALQAMADYDVSQRRACRLVGVDPKTVPLPGAAWLFGIALVIGRGIKRRH